MSSSRWFLVPGSKNSSPSTLKKNRGLQYYRCITQLSSHLDKINYCKGERPAKQSAREALAKLEMVAPVSQSELSRAEDKEIWRTEPR
jgi:hypothetical protein